MRHGEEDNSSSLLITSVVEEQSFFMGHTVERRRVKFRPVRWGQGQPGGCCGRLGSGC